MKEGLHPEFTESKITCACGNVIETKSTKKAMNVDICSKCHPFWTGNLKQTVIYQKIIKRVQLYHFGKSVLFYILGNYAHITR